MSDQWRIHHRAETNSTNLDARVGEPFEVFTADYQTAGRGRLDHKWNSPRGKNLMMSVVLPVGAMAVEMVATLPLVIGLAVAQAISKLRGDVQLKWPNDVLINGRKVAGILCERNGDKVIVGIGVNVKAQDFAPEIAARATFIGDEYDLVAVRDAILERIRDLFGRLRVEGFAALLAELNSIDSLKGHWVVVKQTDDDDEPIRGICGGIMMDGSLDVGGVAIYAGEAHIMEVSAAVDPKRRSLIYCL